MAGIVKPLNDILKELIRRASTNAKIGKGIEGASMAFGVNEFLSQLLGGMTEIEVQAEMSSGLQVKYDISDADADSVGKVAMAILSDDDMLLPRSRETGDIKPIQYLVFDLVAGRAWGLAPGGYNSRKSVTASRQRGFSGGIRAGRRRTSLTNRLSKGR